MLDYSEQLREHDESVGILTAAMQSGAYDSDHIEALLDQMEFDRLGLVVLSAAYKVEVEELRKREELKVLQASAMGK